METVSKKIRYVRDNPSIEWFNDQYGWTRLPQGAWMADPVDTGHLQHTQDRTIRELNSLWSEYKTKGCVQYANATGEYANVPSETDKFAQIDNWQPTLAKQMDIVVKTAGIFDYIHQGDHTFELVGCSNHFTHIYRTNGGEHLPHIDGADALDDDYIKLMAVLVHWTQSSTGELAIIKHRYENDGRTLVNEWEDRQALPEEIVAKMAPSVGRIYIFPNDTCCHAVLPFSGDEGTRISSRGDLIYRQLPAPKRK